MPLFSSTARLAKEVDVYLREHAEQLSKVKTLEAKVASFSNTAPAPAPAASEDTVEWDWELKNALKVQDDCVQMIEPARARLEEAKEKLEDLLVRSFFSPCFAFLSFRLIIQLRALAAFLGVLLRRACLLVDLLGSARFDRGGTPDVCAGELAEGEAANQTLKSSNTED